MYSLHLLYVCLFIFIWTVSELNLDDDDDDDDDFVGQVNCSWIVRLC